MARLIAFLAGLGFVLVLLISFITGASTVVGEGLPHSAEREFHKHPREADVAGRSPFTKFDRAQLQRGFQVYKEVCSGCHSLRYVAFRNLSDLGYSEAEVKAIADQWAVQSPSINPETGEASTRKNLPADHFPSPYPNDVAARAANNNALPPDLSLITKARHEGTDYVYSLLTGYAQQPAALLKKYPDVKTPKGLYYNPYFANLNIAMPPPLVSDGQVTYADGTKATVDQMSKDVAAFLTWTAEPRMERRHQTGFAVLIFLLVFTALAYMSYQNIWASKKGALARG
ncbi:cytochrome c1 [Sphingomonas sp. ID1715]|uniref:cytochrome c1 n=1 Tax=Sphingomonas sp. ID1715 TaxID=1656898 RepID=UPI0014895ECC|nr:cytochrome c1 [Sphingomonas sp. ID1715]NNM78109.1 cytochrome c1 [Sphingomonas sp. ID1715]